MRPVLISLGLALLSGSCGGGDDAPAAPPLQREAPARSAEPVSPSSDEATSWKIGTTGAGPLRIGMGFRELVPHLTSATDTAAIGDGCEYVEIAGAPGGLGFMVEARRLVRIEVRSGSTPTVEGARIGDTEGRILTLYPEARRRPHKYTDGFYLIALPGAPADTLHRYVFETNGARVTLFRAGAYPPVEYVEGCS